WACRMTFGATVGGCSQSAPGARDRYSARQSRQAREEGKMVRLGRFLTVPLIGALMTTTALAQGAMTDVGTPRDQTLIVQTFDGRAANAGAQNPLNAYAIWRGFRELGWGYLWEMDTATGESYPEMADGFPEVLNDEHTQFRIKI